MIISIVAAMDENRLIGTRGKLPWELPRDMARFRELTMGKSVVMGRKTFESIGSALRNRLNIVLTRNSLFSCSGVVVVGSIKKAIKLAQDKEELMVIGGAAVFEQFLDLAEKMYLTTVHHAFVGDAYFPSFNSADWVETERKEIPADEYNSYACTFLTLERVRNLED